MSEIEAKDGPKLHSPLGASGSHRWMNCPGSVNLIAKLGSEIKGAGDAARQGTAAHEILERCLKGEREPWEFANESIEVEGSFYTVDQDMINAVAVAVQYISDLKKQYDNAEKVEYIEQPLQHSIVTILFGTTDYALLINMDGDYYLVIVDYKHGINVGVEPTSSQLRYYAALVIDWLVNQGVIQSPDQLSGVELTIVQPRHPHSKGPIRTQRYTSKEIVDWFEGEVFDAVSATQKSNAPLVVGDWCKFCPGRDRCPALRAATQELNTAVEPEELTPEACGEILQRKKIIEEYLDRVNKAAFAHLAAGRFVPGFKLVNAKANRAWKDDAEAALKAKFGEAAYSKPSLLSPAQIEKLPDGKMLAARWSYKPQTGLTIAPESDSRERVRPPMELFAETMPVD